MSGTYVISVNRPRPEHGASIGGPSIAISPSGEVIAETQDTVTIVDLSRSVWSSRPEPPIRGTWTAFPGCTPTPGATSPSRRYPPMRWRWVGAIRPALNDEIRYR